VADLRSLLAYCKAKKNPLLDCLRQAVEIESPSHDRAAVNRLAEFFVRQLRDLGGQVRLLKHVTAGSAVVAEFWKQARANRPILLLGHLDTVWEVGTLARMPFRVHRGAAYGPGILDMKGGIVCALWAIRALQELQITPASPVRMFLNSDEEVSSVSFREEILAEARRARAVLVLEPASAHGALKTSRKGVGEFRLTVVGRAAHAGVNPSGGVNAISELARQILRIEKLARPRRGLTLGVNVVHGGTRSNVTSELATASIDVRVPSVRDREEIERKMHALQPVHSEAKLIVAGGVNRPPMERKMAIGLFRQAQELGRQMGMDLQEASTGGGSDGNFSAALGIPTLDGLGATGDGAHARHEHVIIRELPQRAALLAALLASL